MGRKIIDLTGWKFGRLTVIERAGSTKERLAVWACKCLCGNIISVRGVSLHRGDTKSCGCLRKERMTTHGMSRTEIYGIWRGMLQRCRYKKHKAYKNYGGRGITVCKRWLKFKNFYADMGERPASMSLDRILIDGNYEPGNVQWATDEQQRNNTRTNRKITYNNQTLNVTQWTKKLGMGRGMLSYRLQAGWTIERALS